MSDISYKWLKDRFDKKVILEDDEWEDFSNCLKPVEIKKKHHYLKVGNFTNKIGFIKKGILAAIEVKEDGSKLVHYFYHLPSCPIVTLYESLITNTPNIMTIEAIIDCELVEAKNEDLLKIYKKYPRFDKLGRAIAEDHYFFNKYRINAFQEKEAKERYDDFIKDTGELILNVPQHMVASYLGISQYTLSKIKGKKVFFTNS